MGMIQSSINNLLTLSAAASKLNPKREAVGKALDEKNRALKKAKVERDFLKSDEGATGEQVVESFEAIDKAYGDNVTAAEAAYEASPSMKNKKAVFEARELQKQHNEAFEDLFKSAKAKAKAEGRLINDVKLSQESKNFRKNFQDPNFKGTDLFSGGNK